PPRSPPAASLPPPPPSPTPFPYTTLFRSGSVADQCLAVCMVVIGHPDQPQRRDLHRPRRQGGRSIAAGERISAPPVNLDCRVGRRRLPNRADKARKHRLDRGTARAQVAFADNFALTVIGRAGDTPANAEAVAFASGHC